MDAGGGRERPEAVAGRLLKLAKSKKSGKPKPVRKAKSQPAGEKAEHTSLYASMPLWARPGFLIRRLHQINYALFFEECAGFDITPVQYALLTTLSLNPDTDQHTLGREVGIDRTNVADVLRRLEQRGLLTRRKGEQDRRAVLARPDAGRGEGHPGDVQGDAARAGAPARAFAAQGARGPDGGAAAAGRREQPSRPHGLSAELRSFAGCAPCLPVRRGRSYVVTPADKAHSAPADCHRRSAGRPI
ncbi:DNA-binding Lrp family transcriptional regulator [Bradyrhizobium sp. USDA 10063]